VLENGSGTCRGTGGWGSAIKIMLGADDVIVRGNKVYENCGEGIGVTRGLNILIDSNTVRDNYSVNIYLDNSPYSIAQYNTVSCTGIYLRNGLRPNGIVLAEEIYSGWGAQRHDNKVLNNTVSGCYDGIASWLPEVAGGKLINATISGNTVSGGTRRSITLSAVNQNVLIENNKVFTAISVYYPKSVTLRNNFSLANALEDESLSEDTVIEETPEEVETAEPAPTESPAETPIEETDPATTDDALTQDPVLALPEAIYDDLDSNLTYTGVWQDISTTQAYGGSYKVTFEPGASLSLNFSGQYFSIFYANRPACGNMLVYVDGALVSSVPCSAPETTPQRWSYPGELAPGDHALTLVFDTGYGSFDSVIAR
jgi:hypothetical protein